MARVWGGGGAREGRGAKERRNGGQMLLAKPLGWIP